MTARRAMRTMSRVAVAGERPRVVTIWSHPAKQVAATSRSTASRRGSPAVSAPAYVVTGYDPPARFAGNGTAGPVRFREEYSLTTDGAATILTQSILATPRGPFRLAEGTLRRQLQQLIAADLDRFKNLAEAEIPRD